MNQYIYTVPGLTAKYLDFLQSALEMKLPVITVDSKM